MYNEFKNKNILNKELAKKFKEKIFEPGSSIPAEEMVKNFLDRDVNYKPFFKNYGINE